jgi:predicted TIM-barrel fold metal-dependent hydrolase
VQPYRPGALAALEAVAAAGAVLVKWLPIHQNISAVDDRTVAFLRRAAELRIAMLVHYGGEMSLSRQHMEFESALPMLGVLRDLRAEGRMPTVIVAHVATPSFPWQSSRDCHAFIDAMLGEFRDEPLYADISALAAFGRTRWLRYLARRRALHDKLVWGSDFPIPVLRWPFMWRVGAGRLREIRRLASWIEQDLQLKRALGFDEGVFTRAAKILRVG